ncbi:hypothetical protein [Haloarcula sediminis]|uniref:hypothetical protein n=1 Tax=Haloarcula sediminis TaxID=3111777 RepID=UPI002D78042C|nr:hypothetical protein [Haloarcula sp. CK38]
MVSIAISNECKNSYFLSVIGIISLSVFYRTYIFLFPPGLIGKDPDTYAYNIHSIMVSGNIESVNMYFYSDASLFLDLGAMFGIVGDTTAAEAMMIFPIAVGVAIPTTTASITYRLTENKQASLYATAIAAVASISIWFSYWPIPQTLAAIFWMIFISSAIWYEQTEKKAFFLIAGMMLFTQIFTHKMPLLIMLASTGAYICISLTNNKISKENPLLDQRWIILVSMTAIALVLQWTYLTDLLISIRILFVRLLSTGSVSLQSTPGGDPSHAIRAYSGLYGILIRRVHAFVLLPLGGIGWLYLLLNDSKNQVGWIIIAASSTGVAFISLGLISPSLGPIRAVLMTEPFLAVLAAIAITGVYSKGIPHWPNIARLLLAIILVSQLSVIYVSPDHPSHPRMYLSNEEVQGKQFGHEYVDNPIYTDGYFANELTPYEINHNLKEKKRYSSYTPKSLNGNLTSHGYQQIAYRTNVDVYSLNGGIWRLIWEPETHLRTHYNKTYSNGGLDIYWQRRGESSDVA